MEVSLPDGELRTAVRACKASGFAELCPDQRATLLDGFLRYTAAPRWMVDWTCDRWPGGEGRGRRALRSKTALLTYQGVWGVVNPE
eukprot:170975-Lingulodinium_polyedra.AAC.1